MQEIVSSIKIENNRL